MLLKMWIPIPCFKMWSQRALRQRSPTPGPRTSTGLWPVRNRAAQQEVSGGRASEASSAAPHRSHHRLNHSPAPPAPSPWKNCLPRNQSLVPKRLGTAGLREQNISGERRCTSFSSVSHCEFMYNLIKCSDNSCLSKYIIIYGINIFCQIFNVPHFFF